MRVTVYLDDNTLKALESIESELREMASPKGLRVSRSAAVVHAIRVADARISKLKSDRGRSR